MKRKCETMQTVRKMMMVNEEEMWRVRMGCGSARQGLGRNIVETTIFTHTLKKWQQRAFKHADLFRYVGAEFVLWTLVLVIITLTDIRTADGHEKKNASHMRTYIFCECLVSKYFRVEKWLEGLFSLCSNESFIEKNCR